MGKPTYGSTLEETTTCCACFPLRVGVFAIALFSLLTSLLTLFAKAIGVDTSVAFGGYTLESKTFILFLEVSGAIWGIIGLLGAWNCHANSVTVFFYYQVARCLCWTGVFYFDLPALYACEQWITNMAGQPEWNPKVYQVAMEGLCWEKRMLFYLVNVPLFFLFCYFTYVNYQFIEMLNDGLPRMFGDRKAPSAFFAQSLAERVPLNASINAQPQVPQPQPLVAPNVQTPNANPDDDYPQAYGPLPSPVYGYPKPKPAVDAAAAQGP
jgi:hypothetical protein